ncbi:MAG: HhH-GPD family protein [Thermoplasmataceae archaeon]
MADFAEELISWWKVNGRPFPWRSEKDSYRILIAEILLHRTRAESVLPVYREFIIKYPSIESLARAEQKEIENILHPLGLFWRSVSLSLAAKQIIDELDGEIPRSADGLRALPGIGSYIASAVRCFAFGEPDVLLDTNIVRVLGRLYGERITDGSRRSTRYLRLAECLLDKNFPREFNYAMIDLAASICRPTQPRCPECPVNVHCSYFYSECQGKIPNNL